MKINGDTYVVLLGQAPPSSSSSKAENETGNTVLLTNDLTAAVVDEALAEGAKMIVCYRTTYTSHPHIGRTGEG